MGPIDYTRMLRDPMQAAVSGLQVGGMLNQQAAQRQQAEAAAEAQRAMQADLQGVLAKGTPTASDYAALTVKYPQFNKQFEQAWGMLNEEQKTNRVSQASEVYAALEAGETDVAQQLLETQAQAAENSDDPRSAKAARTLSEMIMLNPDSAKTSVGLRLASMMGPDKFTETFTKLEADRRARNLEESDLTAAQSKAYKAAVEADFADSNAVADLQKKGWDVFKIQEDAAVARENSRIAALNAQIKREANDLKREQLEVKLDEMKRKRDETVDGKVAEVESARGNIDNMLNTLDRVMQTPMGVIENATGPIDQFLPTTRQSTADFEELVSTIDSQAFLAQIPNMKGLGALSDAEGKKLSAALQNFSLRQSPERLMENVREAQRLLLKARQNVARRYGVPETVPDTPASEPTPEELQQFRNQYLGGS